MLKLDYSKEVQKIVLFILKTLKKTGLKNVVIGWSGGIDSTICLFLLAKAIPRKNIHVLHLPYNTSFIKELKNLRVKGLFLQKENIHEISIKKSVDGIWQTICRDNSRVVPTQDKIRLGNIMARVRMIMLFDYAKKINGMVCGTENKTEHLLGYFTRYGDGASDIEPIQHLYKTQVFNLAKYLEVPKIFINKSPSANLWNKQTDEGEFGFTYKEADEVLLRYIDTSKSLKEIEQEGFTNAKKIIEFMKKNEFKRKVPYYM